MSNTHTTITVTAPPVQPVVLVPGVPAMIVQNPPHFGFRTAYGHGHTSGPAFFQAAPSHAQVYHNHMHHHGPAFEHQHQHGHR